RAWLARYSQDRSSDRREIPAQALRFALQKANGKRPRPPPLVPSLGHCRFSPKAARQMAPEATAVRGQDSSSSDPSVNFILDRKMRMGRLVSRAVKST